MDGIRVAFERGRARRIRAELADLGLAAPPMRRTTGGLVTTLGAAPVARDLGSLVELLERFHARTLRVEIARDLPLEPDADLEEQLDALLARLRLRDLPERPWYQPPGLACRYLGPAEQPLNGCAYVLARSKIDPDSGPVAHVEARLRGSALRANGFDDLRRIIHLADSGEAAFEWRASFAVPRARVYARARAGAVGTPPTP